MLRPHHPRRLGSLGAVSHLKGVRDPAGALREDGAGVELDVQVIEFGARDAARDVSLRDVLGDEGLDEALRRAGDRGGGTAHGAGLRNERTTSMLLDVLPTL